MSSLVYHTTVVMDKDGTLVLEHLPFKKGQMLEVAVYDLDRPGEDTEDPFSLRAEPLYDEDPFAPVAMADWEALQ